MSAHESTSEFREKYLLYRKNKERFPQSHSQSSNPIRESLTIEHAALNRADTHLNSKIYDEEDEEPILPVLSKLSAQFLKNTESGTSEISPTGALNSTHTNETAFSNNTLMYKNYENQQINTITNNTTFNNEKVRHSASPKNFELNTAKRNTTTMTNDGESLRSSSQLRFFPSPRLHTKTYSNTLSHNKENDISHHNNNEDSSKNTITNFRRSKLFGASRLSSLTSGTHLGPAQRAASLPVGGDGTESSNADNFSSFRKTSQYASPPADPARVSSVSPSELIKQKKLQYRDIDFENKSPVEYMRDHNLPPEDLGVLRNVYLEKYKEQPNTGTWKPESVSFQTYKKNKTQSLVDHTGDNHSVQFYAGNQQSQVKDNIVSSNIMPPATNKKRKHVSMAPQVRTDHYTNQDTNTFGKQDGKNQRNEFHNGSTQQEYVPLKPPSLAEPLQSSRDSVRNMVTINGVEYEKVELLGKGGSSKVYKIKRHHPSISFYSKNSASSNRVFALKQVLFDELDESSIDTFKGEIQLLYKLQNKSRVVKLIDYEMLQGLLYLVMECGDHDLSLILSNRLSMPLDLDFVKYHFKEMCLCVKEVHDAGVIHSDLKPANFVFVQGVLKIIDFGIANAVPEHTVNIYRESQIGTPSYMAPEALIRLQDSNASFSDEEKNVWRVGKPSDIWSCGCILYQMVYGKSPYAHFQGKDRLLAIMSNDVEITYPAHGLGNVAVPRSVIELIKLCLKRNASKRITIDEILDKSNFLNAVFVTEDFMLSVVKSSVKYGVENASPSKIHNLNDKRIESLTSNVWNRLNELHL
ncbi:hypothetical protein ACO0QE_001495 [Hanseniaspora vineae]